MKTIYLDHCATTPVRPEVLRVMVPVLKDSYGNPSSIHSAGRTAREVVERAREHVARLIGALPTEIVFTGGGTEANNLAVLGVVQAREGDGKHIITSAIEHHSILRVCRKLEGRGIGVTYLSVDRWGLVDPGDVAKAITKETILISIMHGNNEIGTLEPLAEIRKIAAERGVLFHTDAIQTVGKVVVDVKELAVDLLSLSAHKMYGPKGVGALYVREGIGIAPLIIGGNQERGIRSGTENVASIAGFGTACELAKEEIETEPVRLAKLRDLLREKIAAGCEGLVVNGHPVRSLKHVLSVSVPNLAGEDIVREMDKRGTAVSAGSACTSHSVEISHVISALGLPRELAKGTVRFSLGRSNTRRQIEQAATAFLKATGHLKALAEIEASLGSRKCF